MGDLSFLETDSNQIYNDVVQALESGVNEPLFPGDERRIFADALAAVIVAVYNKTNLACKAKMVQYANGEALDALGERYNCDRISPVPAKTTLRFSVNSSLKSNVIIPKGTRATPDNEVYFQTTEIAVLEAGMTSVDVSAECTESGSEYNGYTPGTINQPVDLIPFIDAVSNTVESYDGDDGEPYPEEDGGTGDEHYRDRIKLAPTSLSCAGPRDAYEFYAKSADASISDVVILSDKETLKKTLKLYDGHAFIGGRELLPDTLIINDCVSGTDYTTDYTDEDLLVISFNGDKASLEAVDATIQQEMECKVLIVPMLEGGKIPDEEVLQKVRDACNADDVRPMTDLVEVKAPEPVSYDINITYYTSEENEEACVQAIEGDGGAIDQYKAWQDTRLGRDINPDKLRALCLAPPGNLGAGCSRIVVNAPEDTDIGEIQIAAFSGNLTVHHELESE